MGSNVYLIHFVKMVGFVMRGLNCPENGHFWTPNPTKCRKVLTITGSERKYYKYNQKHRDSFLSIILKCH